MARNCGNLLLFCQVLCATYIPAFGYGLPNIQATHTHTQTTRAIPTKQHNSLEWYSAVKPPISYTFGHIPLELTARVMIAQRQTMNRIRGGGCSSFFFLFGESLHFRHTRCSLYSYLWPSLGSTLISSKFVSFSPCLIPLTLALTPQFQFCMIICCCLFISFYCFVHFSCCFFIQQ